MLKEFLLKKMMQSQLDKAGVPAAQQQQMLQMVMKNPELFKQIAEEIQAKVKGGQEQMQAAMEVMQAHKQELEKLK